MLKPMKRVEQPPSLSHSVQTAVKEYITTNHLRPGDALPPETELVRLLGISRNSVREAVKALAALGIIDVRRGSGLFVGRFSFEPLLDNLSYGLLFELRELADLLEVRRVLEVGMIEAAMRTMGDEQRDTLREIIIRMQHRAERGEDLTEEDREFHRVLFANLHNTILLRLLDTFWLTFRKASEHTDLHTRDPLQTYRDHAEIVEAVVAGDAAGARTALEGHYAGVVDRLTSARQEQLA